MSRVAAVILAAGASRRLGEPKQLAVVGGKRLLELALHSAVQADCAPVIVVLGAKGEEIRAECDLSDACVVVNPAWAEGMGGSIRMGVEALQNGNLSEEVDGVVLMTCDQPAVTGEHLCRLMRSGSDQVVASSYSGRRGVPAYFPAGWFGALRGLAGEAGARALLDGALTVELPDGELDVDTAETLELARRLYG